MNGMGTLIGLIGLVAGLLVLVLGYVLSRGEE